MLGVVLMQRMCYAEALHELLSVARQSEWVVPEIRHNLGLCVAQLLGAAVKERLPQLLAEFVAWDNRQGDLPPAPAPLVSVVLPSYNHSRFVAQALDSVAAQTYRNFELIVIDDGSRDESPKVIEEQLQRWDFPSRFLARENRGAPATLNEGASLARGEYLAFLNSDDAYSPERLERMVARVAAAGKGWGFSEVAFMNEEGAPEGRAAEFAAADRTQRRQHLGGLTNSIAIAVYNFAISTGNLFLRRSLFENLGGFREFRYNHDWDFCLRASREAEPVFVNGAHYSYRVHAANTIAESRLAARADASAVLAQAFQAMGRTEFATVNPLSAWSPANRAIWLEAVLRNGQGEVLAPELLEQIAQDWLSRDTH